MAKSVKTTQLLLDKMKTSTKKPVMRKGSVQKDMGAKGAKAGCMPKSIKGSSASKMGGNKGLKMGHYTKPSKNSAKGSGSAY